MENSLDFKNESTKKWLWVPCPLETFKPAYILDESSDSVTVQSNTSETFKTSQVFKMNPSNFDKVEDLALLSHLNEPSVLHNLKKRYDDSIIYTYSGLFLISLNPYKSLNIYNDDVKKGISLGENYPHIFSIANKAYKAMLSNKESQSILITGESGAGKTENTKRVIEFITHVSKNNTKNNIDVLIQSTNPILEAFGNAKTIKNDNSSRFGKFIQLKFKGGLLCGARIEKYLLEKSRITHQNPNERTYHIFYYLLKGGSSSLLENLRLSRDPNDYRCLRNTCHSINGIDDSVEFNKLENCFKNLNIECSYYNEVAAILHMSNIQFHSSNVDSNGIDKVFIDDMSPVENTCHLLNIPVTDFIKSILYLTMRAGSETVTHYRSVEECYKVLEGLMRSIYESLFDRLIFQINSVLDCNSDSGKPLFIGVLDIAGFEIFKNNSFEQLCINYTNEKLQQFFNHHMFILEQEIYEKENIDWSFIDFGLDLEPTIKIIESSNPIGILSYLDEECVMPKANDDTLLEKIVSINGIDRVQFKRGFKLKHYAGSVEYSVDGWIEKNNDHSDKSLSQYYNNDDKSMSQYYNNDNSIVKKGIFRTVAQSHRENLKRLMELLRQTNPHFVRCILPNLNKSDDEFDKKLILDQLRCNGVLEGIRISRLGYPTRISYSDFNTRYAVIVSCDDSVTTNTEIANRILRSVPSISDSDYRLGNTMVFLRQGILADIEDLREKIITDLSRAVRRILDSKVQAYLLNIHSERNKAISVLQSNARLSLEFLRWKWWSLFIKVKPLLEVQKNEENVREKEEQLREYSALIEKEREEKKNLNSLLSSINNSYEELKKSDDLLRLALSEKEALLDGLRTEKENLLGRIRETEKKIVFLQEKVDQSSIKEENHSRTISELTSKVELLSNELTNNDMSEEVIRLNNLIEKYEKENSLLKDKVIDLNNLLGGLEEKNTVNSDLISGLKVKISELKLENDDLQFDIKRKTTELSKKDFLLQENSKKIEDLKAENNSLEETVATSNRQLTSIKTESENLKNKITEYENIIQSYNRQIENLRDELSKNNEIYLDQQSNNDLIASLEKQVKSLSSKIFNLEGLNKDICTERNELYSENQRLSKEKIEMMYNNDMRENKEKKVLQLEIQKLRNENEKLRNESGSSHDENNILLEEERNMRRKIEKRLNEVETSNIYLENRLREYEREMALEIEKYNSEFVSKDEIEKLREGLNKIRKEISQSFGLFQNEYFSLVKRREKAIEDLVDENGRLNRLLLENQEIQAEIQQVKSTNEVLVKEMEEFSRKNSLLKIELDGMVIQKDADRVAQEELRSLIEKMKEERDEREKEVEKIIKEYNERLHKLKQANFVFDGCMESINNNGNEVYPESKCYLESGYYSESSSSSLRKIMVPFIAPLNNKIAELTEELSKLTNQSIEKDLEISILKSNLEKLNLLLANQPVSTVEIQKTIPVQIIDKDLLKSVERKRILNCNCTFMNKVKIVEVLKNNGEDIVKLNNEKGILELKLRQAERRLEDQERLIEGMKMTIGNIKTK